MKLATIVGLSLLVLIVTLASHSWSAGSTTGPATGGAIAQPEPITGEAAIPNPGSETQAHDPFTLYDTGQDPWSYDQLENDDLRAQVDRGRKVAGWTAVHDGFAAASREAAQEAQAASALHQLGIQDSDALGSIGVVP